MSIPLEIKERIFTAADHLYEALERKSFPTVDNVRREAKTDMNAASAVMREWRKSQSASPIAVTVAIPESLNKSVSELLASVWTQAQTLANDTLVASEVAWAAERQEYDVLRGELADAHDVQRRELDELATLVEAGKHDIGKVAKTHAEQVHVLNRKIASVEAMLHESREAHASTRAQHEMLIKQCEAQSQRLLEIEGALQSAAEKMAGLQEKLIITENKATDSASQVDTQVARAISAEQKFEIQAALLVKAQADAELAYKRADEAAQHAAQKIDTTQVSLSVAEQRAARFEGQTEALEKQIEMLVKAIEAANKMS